MTTVYILAFFIVVLLTAYKGKGRHIYNFALHGTALSLIHILVMFFGPAKYTVDLNNPSIHDNGKAYLFVWSINRMLPFEFLARPYMLVPKFDGSHDNEFYPIPNKALKQKILDEVRERRRNSDYQPTQGYTPYQGEGAIRQYLAFYLYLVWFVLYYSVFKRKKVANTVNRQTTKGNNKADAQTPSEVNIKRLSPSTIMQQKSRQTIDEWIAVTKGLSFFRYFYKRSRLTLLQQRREQITKEIVTTFGVITNSMEAKKYELYESNIAFMKKHLGQNYKVNTPDPSTYQFLMQWVYQLMTHGIFEMRINITFTSSRSSELLKEQQKQDLNVLSENYEIVFSALENDTDTRGKREIEKQLIKTIQNTLDVFLPEPIFTINQDADTVLNIDFANEANEVTSRPDFNYVFGTVLEGKASFYHFNRWKVKASLTAENIQYDSDYIPLNSKTAEHVASLLKNKESGKYTIYNKNLNGSLPKQIRTVTNMTIARSTFEKLLVSGNSKSTQSNLTIKSKEQINSELNTLFDQIREEIRDSLLEELTAEPCEKLVESILESNHPLVDECMTKVISMSAALGIALDEEMAAELASMIATELAMMATTAAIEGATS